MDDREEMGDPSAWHVPEGWRRAPPRATAQVAHTVSAATALKPVVYHEKCIQDKSLAGCRGALPGLPAGPAALVLQREAPAACP